MLPSWIVSLSPSASADPKGSGDSVLWKNAISAEQRPVREPFIFQTVQLWCHGLCKKECFIRTLVENKNKCSGQSVTLKNTHTHTQQRPPKVQPSCFIILRWSDVSLTSPKSPSYIKLRYQIHVLFQRFAAFVHFETHLRCTLRRKPFFLFSSKSEALRLEDGLAAIP